MGKVGWWLVDVLSRALPADEGLAARGDLTESAVPARRAVREMLGLVLRRQAVEWARPRPWLALLTVALPSGILLGNLAQFWSQGSAAYLWLFVTGADPRSLNGTVWRIGAQELAALAPWLGLNAVTVAAWAWVAGSAVRSMAHRAILTVAPAFLAALVLGTVGAVPIGGFSGSAPSSTVLYGVIVPALLRVGLVALPLLGGLMLDSGSAPLRRMRTLAALTVGVLALRTLAPLEIALLGGWTSALVVRGHWAFRFSLAMLMVWPSVYLLFCRDSPGRYLRASSGGVD